MNYFLGIDSGLRRIGWGLILKDKQKLLYIASGVFKTTIGNTEIYYHSDGIALKEIYNFIYNLISEKKPTHCAVENTYVNNNPLSSLKLAQARSAVIIACCNHDLLPREYQASTIKKIVSGRGNADKLELHKMINIQLGNIKTTTNDESDAIAIAMCDALHH